MAGGTVFQEAGVPAIGVTCTNPQVTSDCSCLLPHLLHSIRSRVTVLASYAYKELGRYHRLYAGDARLVTMTRGLCTTSPRRSRRSAARSLSEDFPEGNANFVSYINNAKSAGAGVIFAPVSTNYAQLIIEAAGAQGFEGHLLGSDTWDNNMVIESAKGKSVNVEMHDLLSGRRRT